MNISSFREKSNHLISMYRQGKFEEFAFEGILFKDAITSLFKESKKIQNKIKSVSDNDKPQIALLVLKVEVICFETLEYFIEEYDEQQEFVDHTREFCKDYQTCYISFCNRFDIPQDSDFQKEFCKYLVLKALCGINQIYRNHKSVEYAEALDFLTIIEDFVNTNTSYFQASFGLKGLIFYLKGLLNRSIPNYTEAETEFRKSIEFYSKSLEVISSEFENKKLKTPNSNLQILQLNYEEKKFLVLRRCALSSIFGLSFHFLVTGKIKDCLSFSALAKNVLQDNCGIVYKRYAELLYAEAKLAENISSEINLNETLQILNICYEDFDRLNIQQHKFRVRIAQSLVLYYQARLAMKESDGKSFSKISEILTNAENYLSQTIKFAKDNKKMQLLCDASTNLTFVKRFILRGKTNISQDDILEIENLGRKALTEMAKFPSQLCEAYLALGAMYADFAQRTTAENQLNYIDKSRDNLNKALEHNGQKNLLVTASALLRLCEISLLQKSHFVRARYYYNTYLKISQQLQHDYCRVWADELKPQIERLDEYFFVFPNEYDSFAKLEVNLRDYVLERIVSDVADEVEVAMRFPTITLNNLFETAFKKWNIANTTAHKWIHDYNLINKLHQLNPLSKNIKHKTRKKNKTL
jgi:hypothetical protein